MPFTDTLFGGLLVVAALFFVARRLRLSNYWSAVISGALPFLTYLGYSTKIGVAGDVLAVHFAVFMATAGVLGVFGNMYQKKEGLHWAPKLIIAFFVVLVLLMAGFVFVSINGLPTSLAKWVMPNVGHQSMHTGFPGAIPHDRNHLYEPHLQRMEQQRNLGWKVALAGLDSVHKGIAANVTLTVVDKSGNAIDGAKVTLDLWRMANSADDRKLELVPQGKGKYATSLQLTDAGNWIVEIYIERDQDSYLMQQPITVTQ
jgi:hypothetical protein